VTPRKTLIIRNSKENFTRGQGSLKEASCKVFALYCGTAGKGEMDWKNGCLAIWELGPMFFQGGVEHVEGRGVRVSMKKKQRGKAHCIPRS